MEHEIVLSHQGLEKLELELERLKTVKRKEVAQRIKHAREFGAIEENSEYEDAKNEQAFIEGRILTLERMLRNARLIDEVDVDPSKVHVGSTVRLRDTRTGEEFCYTIVGSAEAEPSCNRISCMSPIGKAVLGHCPGETIEVEVPAGNLSLEILSLEGADTAAAAKEVVGS